MDRLGLLCRNIYENNKMTQRELAAAMDISLGTCNHLVKEGLDQELFSFDPVDGSYSLLKGGVDLLRNYRMDSAVILAAGASPAMMASQQAIVASRLITSKRMRISWMRS